MVEKFSSSQVCIVFCCHRNIATTDINDFYQRLTTTIYKNILIITNNYKMSS